MASSGTNVYANTQPSGPAQMPVMMMPVSAPGAGSPRDKYKAILRGLGITEVVLGSVVVLLWIMTVVGASLSYGYRGGMTFVSSGLWCGVFLFISGGLGIGLMKNQSGCMYNANMVMSMIGAIAMFILVIMSGIAAAVENYYSVFLTLIHSLLAVTGFAAGIVCIVHSAYCCAGTCCLREPHQGTVVYSAAPVAQPQQFVQLANGQLVPVQNVSAYPPVSSGAGTPVPMVSSYPNGYSQASTSQIAGVPAMMPMTMPTQNTNVAPGADTIQPGFPQQSSKQSEAEAQQPALPSYSQH